MHEGLRGRGEGGEALRILRQDTGAQEVGGQEGPGSEAGEVNLGQGLLHASEEEVWEHGLQGLRSQPLANIEGGPAHPWIR